MRVRASTALLVVAASCGGRSSLDLLLSSRGLQGDGGTGPVDTGIEAADSGTGQSDVHSPGDAAVDGTLGSDGPTDAGSSDASRDVAPPPTLSCADAPGLQPGSPWPIAGRCSARAGSTRALGPTTTPTVAWQATNDAGWSTFGTVDLVVAADGTIYTVDANGSVVAVAPGGGIRWRTPPVDSGMGSSFLAIAADGTLYVSSDGLSAYHPDGTLAWSNGTTNDAFVYGPAVAADGTIYVVGSMLTAVEPTGATRWQISLGDPAEAFGPPAVGANGTVYVVVATWTGIVLDAFTPQGATAWSVPLNTSAPANNAVSGAPVVVGDDGTVYAPCSGGVCTFTPDGQPLATFGGVPMAGIALAPDVGLVYATFDSNYVTAFAADGGMAWTYAVATPDLYQNSVVLTDGRGSVLLSNGSVTATVAADGGLLWMTDAQCRAMGADGTLYCISSDNTTMTALSP